MRSSFTTSARRPVVIITRHGRAIGKHAWLFIDAALGIIERPLLAVLWRLSDWRARISDKLELRAALAEIERRQSTLTGGGN